MKNIILPIIGYLLLFVGSSKATETTSAASPLPGGSYVQAKSKAAQLKKSCRKMSIQKAGQQFVDNIAQQIVPHWIGTPWDFNGITQSPGKGKIACGYFVTTVLRDAGVKINRVKMAQCASETKINSLTKNKRDLIVSQISL